MLEESTRTFYCWNEVSSFFYTIPIPPYTRRGGGGGAGLSPPPGGGRGLDDGVDFGGTRGAARVGTGAEAGAGAGRDGVTVFALLGKNGVSQESRAPFLVFC